MKKIRTVFLQNSRGERYGLNGEHGVYVSDLSGLGLAASPAFAQLDHGFYLPIQTDTVPQAAPSGTLWFTQHPYEEYQRFTGWLASAGALRLIYNPTWTQEYSMDVTINSLQKGELDSVGWLSCPGAFFACSPWYREAGSRILPETAASVRRYDYTYDADLHYGSGSDASLSAVIPGIGHLPGAFRLQFAGRLTNPVIQLVGSLSGKLYGRCIIPGEIHENERLDYSCKYEDSHAYKLTANGEIADLLDELDLQANPFPKLSLNEPCILSVSSESPISGPAELTVWHYYRSV